MNLQRILIIDRCLRDTRRKWTLQDLIDACRCTESNSRRSVQADIELMRSKERGYSAPIVVVDRKYYTYSDEQYSLLKQALTGQDVDSVMSAIETIGGYCAFAQMSGVSSSLFQLHERIAVALGLPLPERPADNGEQSAEPQLVRLWIDAEMADEVRTRKLHETQFIEQEEIDGSINIRLNMPLTFELENFIVDNSRCVKVTSPASLQNRIKKRLAR